MESDEFSIKSLTIDPEVSPLCGPVTLIMDFSSPRNLPNAIWRVFYQIDTIRKRKKLEVLSLPPQNFSEGINPLIIQIPSIDIESAHSINAGILLLTLSQNDEELLGINMIVQVTQKEGQLYKTIFSPLE